MLVYLDKAISFWKPLVGALVVLLSAIIIKLTFFPFSITGIYFLIYLIVVWLLTTWLTFLALQTFLQQNKALSLDKWLNLPKIKQSTLKDLNCINQLTIDIDHYFIKKWFVYISKDETFNNESKAVLEEVLKRLINVLLSTDINQILPGFLNIYLKHLKEFRRAIRRRDKYGGQISELYRYSHTCITQKSSRDYYVHQLTINLLNHYINWELNNSLPCRILVAIIAKKFSLFMLNLLSNPEFINYYILYSYCSETKRNELNLKSYTRVKLEGLGIMEEIIEEKPKIDSPIKEKVEIKKAEDLVQFVKEEPVKIYEPKSCKTWYDLYDLKSVSFGQDILNSLEDEGQEAKEDVPSISQTKHFVDEIKHITSMEGIRTSMKPISDVAVNTVHNIKDFHFQESTVNNVVKPVSQATSSALHRIGGLQDEAAGVVEGLLDFGRTRIRKGLRLTGLHEVDAKSDVKIEQKTKPKVEQKAIEQKIESKTETTKKRTITKMPHIAGEDSETTWTNPLQEYNRIPSILHEDGSPELEYEEAEDLATSIAKLRTLLEQKSSESTMSTPSLSPMPPDDYHNKILLENGDEVDGMMPSFYKFCAKTATGVFHNTLNSIKTALPGTIPDYDKFDGAEKWLFIEANPNENDLFVRMNKLLSERKVFCTIDTDYEAIDPLAPLDEDKKDSLPSSIQFEDELDDFEVKSPSTKALLDIICELLADAKDTPLTQEPIIKSILLLFGNYIEDNIKNKVKNLINYGCTNLKVPSETKTETLTLSLDKFVEIIKNGIPGSVKYFTGDDNLKHSIDLFISSLQVQKINQDMLLQVFEILCLSLIEGSKQVSPIPI